MSGGMTRDGGSSNGGKSFTQYFTSFAIVLIKKWWFTNETVFSWHLAAGREPLPGAKFHRSVLWRLENLPRFRTNAQVDRNRIKDEANIAN